VTLEILDSAGALVRRYSSEDPVPPVTDEGNVPAYWIRPVQVPGKAAGAHRFVWDLHFPPPPAQQFSYPIAAIYRNTPKEPTGPWVLQGRYTVRLTTGAGDRSQSQPLMVRMDPRIKTPRAGLLQQFLLSQQLVEAMRKDSAALAEVRALRAQLGGLKERAGAAALAPAIDSLERQAAELEGQEAGRADSFARLLGELGTLYGVLQGSDATPTSQAVSAVAAWRGTLGPLLQRWERLRAGGLGPLNQRLRQAGLPPVGSGA